MLRKSALFSPPPLLLTLLLILTASIARAETILFTAVYDGEYAGFDVETHRTLTKLPNNEYRLTSEASNFLASITETSRFQKTGNQWQPLKYRYKRKVFGIGTTEALVFDWSKGTAQYTHSRKPERNTTHTLQPGLLDPVLYQLRLQQDLLQKGNELQDSETHLSYQFVKRKRIEDYVFNIEDGEPLKAGGNIYDTLKISRLKDENDDKRQTRVWLIPQLDYQIGKILHIDEDGDSHTMVLKRYEADTKLLREFFGFET